MKLQSQREKEKASKAAGTAAQLVPNSSFTHHSMNLVSFSKADKQLAVLRDEMEKKIEEARRKVITSS